MKGHGLGVIVLVATLGVGCGLSEEECLKLRGEAYEVLNAPHTCNDDTGCMFSNWPGCAKPLGRKNESKIADIRAKFDAGKCFESPPECREPPDVYCKQGLCVFRERPGGASNPNK